MEPLRAIIRSLRTSQRAPCAFRSEASLRERRKRTSASTNLSVRPNGSDVRDGRNSSLRSERQISDWRRRAANPFFVLTDAVSPLEGACPCDNPFPSDVPASALCIPERSLSSRAKEAHKREPEPLRSERQIYDWPHSATGRFSSPNPPQERRVRALPTRGGRGVS